MTVHVQVHSYFCFIVPYSHIHPSREDLLSQELREARAEHEQLQIDYLAAIRTRDQALQERTRLQRTMEEQRSTVDSLTDQLCRYKTIEERLFEEKQSLQSQLEALKEEKSKLAKVRSNSPCPSLPYPLLPSFPPVLRADLWGAGKS